MGRGKTSGSRTDGNGTVGAGSKLGERDKTLEVRLFSNGAKMLLALVGEIAKEFQMHRFEGLEEIRKRIQALS